MFAIGCTFLIIARLSVQSCPKAELGKPTILVGRARKPTLKSSGRFVPFLEEVRPQDTEYDSLISYVKDRPGHDRRYAIDRGKIHREIGWKPRETFESGMRKTILWYLENKRWVEDVTSGTYKEWIAENYHKREATCGA